MGERGREGERKCKMIQQCNGRMMYCKSFKTRCGVSVWLTFFSSAHRASSVSFSAWVGPALEA